MKSGTGNEKECPYCGAIRMRLLGDFLCSKCRVYWKMGTGEVMTSWREGSEEWREVSMGCLVICGEETWRG